MKFKNSLNVISAIWSNGLSVIVWVNGTTKSDTILKILRILKYRFENWSLLKLWGWLIILDNCSVHRIKVLKEYFKFSECRVLYNVLYWQKQPSI